MCDEAISTIYSVSTNVANATSTTATSTVLINSNDKINQNRMIKKVRYKMDCYILYTFLLVTMLQFITTIICYHNAKHRSKQNILAHYRDKSGEK